jgi:hypothetical protein
MTSQSEVERIAKAMAESEGWRWGISDGPTNMVDACGSGQDSSRSRTTWRKRARAAIEALREPSEAMISAGVEAATELHPYASSYAWVEFAYKGAIDAALAEPSPSHLLGGK